MVRRLRDIDNIWFFTELPDILKFITIFVRGDLIVLLPLMAAILLTGIFSVKFMVTMLGIYIAVRYFGEMIYWFGHQFSDRSYRPSGNFGFKNLNNHAIYILYQLTSIAGVVTGLGIVIFSLYFWR